MSSENQSDLKQPLNDAAASSEENISEGEHIRRLLVAKIESGKDLRDKDVRIGVCHEIEKELNIPYGNVTKQVEKALKMAAKNSGKPAESFTRTSGGAEVKVTRPKSVPEERQPDPSSGEQASTQPKPAKPRMSEIYAAAANEEELRKTMEYRWLLHQVKTAVAFIEGTYQKIGIIDEKASLIPKEQEDVMYDQTVQMCMKYDWAVPERLEKLIFIGSWGMLLILPPLAKFGILDTIKDGALGKKKTDPKKSDAPLADAPKRV